jgi:hypothetical protein
MKGLNMTVISKQDIKERNRAKNSQLRANNLKGLNNV